MNTTTTAYTLYCTVDGKGDDPKIKDRVSIKLPLIETQIAEEAAIYLAEFLAGHQLTTIQCLEASKIQADSYLTFATATPETFRVSYRKEKQNLPNAILEISTEDNTDSDLKMIPVDLVETDTLEQVAQKTKIAINQFYFAIWDMRGAFIRGWDKDSQVDTGDRFFGYGQGLIKNNLGSFQFDEILSHKHLTFVVDSPGWPQTWGGGGFYGRKYDKPDQFPPTLDTGGTESRPVNFSANFVMKY